MLQEGGISVGNASVVQNDGNSLTPSNVFIEATPAGVSSSTISIATDGSVVIKGDVANILTTLLQLIPSAANSASSVILGDNSRQVEILGTLLVDFSAIAKLLQLNDTGFTNIQPTSGGVGNFDLYQWFDGLYKKVLIKFNSGFKNGTTELDVGIPTGFTKWCRIEFSDCPTFSLLKTGVAQNCTMTTTYDDPSSVTANRTIISQVSGLGMMNGGNGLDQVAFVAGGTQAARNGFLLLEGI